MALEICMLIPNSNAFDKISGLVSVSLQKLENISKPRFKFFSTIFELWLGLPLRYTMLNLGRIGGYCEKSIRLHFEKLFDFVSFNEALIKKSCSKDLIAAFDPSYIPKSGKQTPGLGKWWSGKDQCTLKGLEISCLSIVVVTAGTAMSLEAVQTPSKEVLQSKNQNQVSHYVSIIKKQMPKLKAMVKYLVAHGYFMKHDFILPLLKDGLHIITKMRPDADLRYTYNGPKQSRRGRRKLYDGKVDCNNIDKRRIKKFDEDEDAVYYSGIVYCIALKQLVRIVYLQEKGTNRHKIFVCTDTLIKPALIIKYYRLRFQIEFLIRDAKQHCGLEECQARRENKLYFHFNMALSAVSVAKAAVWLSLPEEKREAFSMRNIKLMYYNKIITERIFSNLALDLNCKKIKQLYNQCLNIGALAA
ncbi:MAG TPA: transposase [Segetibacter sp.]|nr:transposase [Segetibacter sp.]